MSEKATYGGSDFRREAPVLPCRGVREVNLFGEDRARLLAGENLSFYKGETQGALFSAWTAPAGEGGSATERIAKGRYPECPKSAYLTSLLAISPIGWNYLS